MQMSMAKNQLRFLIKEYFYIASFTFILLLLLIILTKQDLLFIVGSCERLHCYNTSFRKTLFDREN